RVRCCQRRSQRFHKGTEELPRRQTAGLYGSGVDWMCSSDSAYSKWQSKSKDSRGALRVARRANRLRAASRQNGAPDRRNLGRHPRHSVNWSQSEFLRSWGTLSVGGSGVVSLAAGARLSDSTSRYLSVADHRDLSSPPRG